MIYTISEDCTISTIKPGAEWSALETSGLEGTCFATPAIVDGTVYIRSLQALYSFSIQ